MLLTLLTSVVVSGTSASPAILSAQPLTEAGDVGAEETDQLSREAVFALRDAIWDQVFNPDLFFDGWTRPDLTFRYSGDDWDWPVWAMAAELSCRTPRGLARPHNCQAQERVWVFRAVEAPGLDEVSRPRHAGTDYLRQVEAQLSAGLELKEAFAAAPPLWLETDLNQCPDAEAPFRALVEGPWPPVKHVFNGIEEDALVLVIHADMIEVTMNAPGQTLVSEGFVGHESPSSRADAFYTALRACFEPSDAPWPWEVYREVYEETED